MKITKTGDDQRRLNALREAANLNCNVCPCCGEKKSSLYYIRRGITNKGISGGICKTWVRGITNMQHYRVDCYKCKTCGAEWESDDYEY